MDQAFAAPLFQGLPGLPDEFGGMVSQLQRKAPDRVSKARTTPAGISTRPLSSIADPTTTMSSITAGGDVMWYQPARKPGTSRRLTSPALPKSAQGAPVAASSAMRRASRVASNNRRRQGWVAGLEGSSHVATPRLISPSP